MNYSSPQEAGCRVKASASQLDRARAAESPERTSGREENDSLCDGQRRASPGPRYSKSGSDGRVDPEAYEQIVIAVDTSLLVYAHRSLVPEHSAARRALTRAAESTRGWGTAFPCIAEFWCIVTHPEATGRPSTPKEASRFLLSLTDAGLQIWYPESGFAPRLLQLAAEHGVSGVRIFDFQIGAISLLAGASTLWTHDRTFCSPPALRVLDPLA